MTVLGCRVPTIGDLAVEQGLGAMSQVAERAGAASVWVGDHVLMARDSRSRYPYAKNGSPPGVEPDTAFHEALVALAWAAAATRSVRVGSAVLILPQRDPLLLAKQAATIDALSGGRLVLGVGAGWLAEEMEALGFDFASRGRRMDESVELMRSCWSGEPPAFEGDFVSLPAGMTCYPRPARDSGIPVLVGGMSEAAVRRELRLGDGWLALETLESADAGALEARLTDLRARQAEAGRPRWNVLRLNGVCATLAALATLRRLAQIGFDELIVEVPWDDLDDAGARLAAAVDACGSSEARAL